MVRSQGSIVVVMVVMFLLLPTLSLVENPRNEQPVNPIQIHTENNLVRSFPVDIDVSSAYFTENVGQMGEGGGRFYTIGDSISVAFGVGWIAYKLEIITDRQIQSGTLFRISFQNSNMVTPEGKGKVDHVSNYFQGNNEENHFTNVLSYREVWYKGIYQNIDLRFYFLEGRLKYDFIINRGGEPADIAIIYEGIERLELSKSSGDLLIYTSQGIVREKAPFAYQQSLFDYREVPCYFTLLSVDSVAFHVTSFNRNEPLIIDPEIIFSTFLGGKGRDDAWGIVVDGPGNVYVTGQTYSTEFPDTTGAYCTTLTGNNDVFVSKLNPDGTKLSYSTYIGGTDFDFGHKIDVDDYGCAYVVGMTNSSDFPITKNAFNSTFQHNFESFVLKLNSTGSELLYSTFIGGDGFDTATDVFVNGTGCAYVLGHTTSTDFPTTKGAMCQTSSGKQDVTFVILNNNGSSLLYGSYIGGVLNDAGTRMCVGEDGSIYLTGWTESSDFPTTSGSNDTSHNGGEDIFVLKLHPQNFSLDYSTFIGGSNTEWSLGICVDNNGNIFVTGMVEGNDFPITPNAFKTSKGRLRDAFLFKLNPLGSRIEFCTYLGGMASEFGYGVQIDDYGRAIVVGTTTSNNFPTTPGALDRTPSVRPRDDIFVTKFNANASALEYSSFINGESHDNVLDIYMDENQTIYMAGRTASTDFPITQSAFDPKYSGDGPWDGFVMKMSIEPPYIGPDSTPSNGTTGDPFSFNATVMDHRDVDNVTVEFWFGSQVAHGNLSLSLTSGTMNNGTWVGAITIPLNSLDLLHYIIHAKDTGGHGTSTMIRNVTIIDNDVPSITNAFKSNATTGDPFNFSAILVDNIGVGSIWLTYWFGHDTMGAKDENMTGTNLSGLANGTYSFLLPRVPAHSLVPLHFYFTANDTSGNINQTSNITVQVLDNDAPIFISDDSAEVPTTGDQFPIRFQIMDNIGVSNVSLYYSFNDGTPIVLSMEGDPLSGLGNGTYSSDIFIPPTYLGNISYYCVAWDTSGNRNRTENITKNVVDNDLPILGTDGTVDTATTGETVTFSIVVQDNIGIEDVWVEYLYGRGSSIKLYLDLSEGDLWEVTITIDDTLEDMHYSIFAVDTSGNLNATSVRTVDIADNDLPEIVEDLSDATATTGEVFHARIRVRDNIGIDLVSSGEDLWTGTDIDDRANGIYELGVQMDNDYVGSFYLFVGLLDLAGNEITYELVTPIIVDNDPPVIRSDLTRDEAMKGGALDFQLVVWDYADPRNISVYVEYRFGQGPLQNRSMLRIKGIANDLHCTFTIGVPRDAEGPVAYRFTTVDGVGNWNSTEERQVTLYNPPPVISDIPTWNITEEQEATLDLEPYMSDENDDVSSLTVECDDYTVTVNGLVLEALYTKAVPDWIVLLTVSDGEDDTEVHLSVHIVNVNDAPVILSISPENGAKFKEGKAINFSVEATDEDGDELTVIWTSDGIALGTGDTLDYKKLKPGTRTIRVTVSDGEASVEDEFTITITKEEESPALGGAFVLLAMLVGMAAVMMRRKQ